VFINTAELSRTSAISSKRAKALEAAMTALKISGTAKSTAGGKDFRFI
jgi:hypothetical protein